MANTAAQSIALAARMQSNALAAQQAQSFASAAQAQALARRRSDSEWNFNVFEEDVDRSRRRKVVAACAAAALVVLSLLRWRHKRPAIERLNGAVSSSARSVAAARALESERPDALFVDPFAAFFAGRAFVESVRQRARVDGRITVRTAFFDSQLLSALRLSPGAQVVLLGAGLDARAWRLQPPTGCPLCPLLVEIDRRDVAQAKAAALASFPGGPPALTLAHRYQSLAVDLRRPGWEVALQKEASHDPRIPTVWVLEGLLYYLPVETVDSVLRAAASVSAPGSSLLASVVNSAGVARARANTRSSAMREFQSAVDDPASFFAARGWRMRLAARPGDESCSFGGRFPAPPPYEPDKPATWYVSASPDM